MAGRRKIDFRRDVPPIYGEPRRVRTFYGDHCNYLSPRLKAWGHFAVDSVVTITLPVIFAGAAVAPRPTIKITL